MSVAELEAADVALRREACRLLDRISRPLTARELEAALLAAGGLSRSQRRHIVRALSTVAIVAVVPECRD